MTKMLTKEDSPWENPAASWSNSIRPPQKHVPYKFVTPRNYDNTANLQEHSLFLLVFLLCCDTVAAAVAAAAADGPVSVVAAAAAVVVAPPPCFSVSLILLGVL